MSEAIHGQAFADYVAAEGINWSKLKDFYYRTPAHAMYSEPKDSTPLDIGHALHVAVLEPYEFERLVIRGAVDRRGNKWKDAVAQSGAATLLIESDYDKLLRIRDAAISNPDIARLVRSNNRVTEVSMYWQDGDIPCKARADLVVDDGLIIADLKTTVSAHPADFSKSVANYAYHGQEAWYINGASFVYNKTPQFLFIAIEKEPPFASIVFELDEVTKREGRAIVEAAYEIYQKCLVADYYPAFPPGIRQLTLPKWGFQLTTPGE